ILILTTIYSFGLVVDYRYEECSGESVSNQASSNLQGLLSGDAMLTQNESTLSFSGDGKMSVEHHSKLDIIKNLTVSLWVNPSELKRQALVVRAGGTGNDRKFGSNAEYSLALWEDGKFKYKHNQTADTYSESLIPKDKWTHIVLVRDDGNKKIKIYINGLLDTSSDYTISPSSSNSEKLLVGTGDGYSSTMKNFKGKLDEIKIYNIALSENEITALFNNEKNSVHSQNHCYVAPAPKALNDSEEVFRTGSITINVLANDVDSNSSDSCTVDASSVQFRPLAGANLSADGKVLTVENQGRWSVADNGSLTFSPLADYLESPTAITYFFSDSCQNQSNDATITLVRDIVTDEEVDTAIGGGVAIINRPPELASGDKSFDIGNRVWYDLNENGLQDEGEKGVEGVVVVLYDNSGNVLERMTTNSSGEYQFANVAEGSYSLGFSNLPDNYIFTSHDVGTDDSKDSDANSVGRTELLTIENSSMDYDAGIVVKEGSTTPTPDDNGTTEIIGEDANHTHSDDCECETYNSSSIPSMGQIGVAVLLLLTSIIGVLFFRNEELS
ncbi:MAG: hypothetical protein K0U38_05180, partial [Epsilonproteobacteria bacterium]|nr:hypothetical protein [Campylobacterota bacterium]